MAATTDSHYDTPWEFTCRSAQSGGALLAKTHERGSPASIRPSSSRSTSVRGYSLDSPSPSFAQQHAHHAGHSNRAVNGHHHGGGGGQSPGVAASCSGGAPPVCGVAASRWQRENNKNATSPPPPPPVNAKPVWERRRLSSADQDAYILNKSTSGDYEIPWEFKKRVLRCYQPPNNGRRPVSDVYGRVWESHSGDHKPNGQQTNGETTQQQQKQQQQQRSPDERNKKAERRQGRLMTEGEEQLIVTLISEPSGEINNDVINNNNNNNIISNGHSKRPMIVEETVFCSKAPPSPPLAQSKAEARNRLIQKVCAGGSPNISSPNTVSPSTSASSSTGDSIRKRIGLRVVKTNIPPSNKSSPRKCHNSPPLSSSTDDKQQAEPASANVTTDDRKAKASNLLTPSNVVTVSSTASTVPCVNDEQTGETYDVPWEFSCKNKLLDRKNFMDAHKGGTRPNVTPSSAEVEKFDRGKLALNFGCLIQNPVTVQFDHTLPLNRQSWFHGNISRAEAEKRLRRSKEGSFLVRDCEKNKNEHALSLKSANGVMHMKIQLNKDGRWVLGYFSQPFPHIPYMMHYYSQNKLPIKGAEHMCLLYPVADILL